MNQFELYALQLLHYFIAQHNYQMLSVRGQRKDVWLLNREHREFPLICITHASDEEIQSKLPYITQLGALLLGAHVERVPILILNTNPQSTNSEQVRWIHMSVAPGTCASTKVNACFPNLTQVIHPSDDPRKEFAKLSRTLEMMQLRMKRTQRKALGMKRIPKLTAGIMLVCLILFIAVFATALYLESDTLALILWGAYYKMNIVAMHEYWRFFSAGFLHLDLFHLLANLLALYTIGTVCEKTFTKGQYISILLVSIIFGNLFVFIAQGNLLALGISGGIFGLLGAYITSLFANGAIRHPMVRSGIWQLLLVNFMISLLPGISLFAHLGGFICGVFMGILFVKSEKWNELRPHVAVSFVLLLGLSSVLALRVQNVQPLEKGVDRALIQSVKALGFDAYAQRMEAAYLRYYSAQELGIENIDNAEAQPQTEGQGEGQTPQ